LARRAAFIALIFPGKFGLGEWIRTLEPTRLGAAFDAIEADGASPKAMAIARLWALTGCRRDEIAGLRWSEIDFERGLLIRITAGHTINRIDELAPWNYRPAAKPQSNDNSAHVDSPVRDSLTSIIPVA
jgi:integrase